MSIKITILVQLIHELVNAMDMDRVDDHSASDTCIKSGPSCSLAEYLVATMIAIMSWLILKWIAKKFRLPRTQEQHAAETNRLSANKALHKFPSDEIDCTTVAVQETGDYDTDEEAKRKVIYFCST